MILLTGGTGFVGRHLAARFLADGHAVRILSRRPPPGDVPPGAQLATGSLLDDEALARALVDVETVVHAAAVLPGPGIADADLLRTNVNGTACLARAAAGAGVRRFVHLSSAGVYGDRCASGLHAEGDPLDADSPYQCSKRAAEDALRDELAPSKVEWTILRPAGLYGADRPATRALFREVARRRVWFHGPATVRLRPTHVDDLMQAVVLVLSRADLRGEVFNVAGDRPVTYRELIAMVGTRIGRAPAQWAAPRGIRAVASGLSRACGGARHAPAFLRRLASGDTCSAVDIRKAVDRLGFRPMSLESGLDRTIAALREEGAL